MMADNGSPDKGQGMKLHALWYILQQMHDCFCSYLQLSNAHKDSLNTTKQYGTTSSFFLSFHLSFCLNNTICPCISFHSSLIVNSFLLYFPFCSLSSLSFTPLFWLKRVNLLSCSVFTSFSCSHILFCFVSVPHSHFLSFFLCPSFSSVPWQHL